MEIIFPPPHLIRLPDGNYVRSDLVRKVSARTRLGRSELNGEVVVEIDGEDGKLEKMVFCYSSYEEACKVREEFVYQRNWLPTEEK
jgi:hypothetical protein